MAPPRPGSAPVPPAVPADTHAHFAVGHGPAGRCAAFRAAMDVLGKPWNGLLLRELEEGPVRFSALAERLAPIGDRMLSCRLKELEAAGLVRREVEPGPPVRVSYALTGAGGGIGEVTRAVAEWGARVLAVRGDAAPGTCEPGGCEGGGGDCEGEEGEGPPGG